MSYKKTEEQERIIEASKTGGSMVIEAGAGAGKTSTLNDIARVKPKRESGVYVAYNRAIAGDAKAKFPRTTQCATAHSFAFPLSRCAVQAPARRSPHVGQGNCQSTWHRRGCQLG